MLDYVSIKGIVKKTFVRSFLKPTVASSGDLSHTFQGNANIQIYKLHELTTLVSILKHFVS